MKLRSAFFVFTVLALLAVSACEPPVLETEVPPTQNTVESPARTSLVWVPAPMADFQIQFSGEIDLSTNAEVIDLDLFETEEATIEQLHQAGKKVICYINAGSFEEWRPDIDQFPAEVIGKAYNGWPGEYWLDIRNLDALAPIMQARMEMCLAKGFDGIEFDNMDGYQNDTGFKLTADDQLAYNRWLADQAHQLGLAVGLKNDPEQIVELEPWFDFIILESCFDQGWCEMARPFMESGKAIFDIEYKSILPYCDQAMQLSITLIQKNLELDAEQIICP